MFQLKPKVFFLVAGDSEGYTPLNAFDNALLEAGWNLWRFHTGLLCL